MVASGPDNGEACWDCQTVRAHLARSEGVTRVNQWLKPRNREAVLKSGGYGPGRSAQHDLPVVGVVLTPKPSSSGGGEAMVKVCGVAVARLPG